MSSKSKGCTSATWAFPRRTHKSCGSRRRSVDLRSWRDANLAPTGLSTLRCAEGAFDASERSTAELGAPGASQESGDCKHQSSSHPAGALAAVSDMKTRAIRVGVSTLFLDRRSPC